MPKIIREKRIYLVDTDNQDSKRLLTEKLYNQSENLISDTNFFPQGGIESKRTLEYDENGNVISETTHGDGGYNTVNKYEYNDENLMVKKTLVYSDGSEEYELLKFEGNNVKIQIIDEDGKTTLIEERIVDDKKNIVEQRYFHEGEIDRIDSFTYDENGNTTQIQIVVPTEDLEFFVNQKFNEQGQLIEKIQLDVRDQILVSQKNTYEGEKLIKEILEDYTEGEKRTITHFVFNENGMKTSERVEDFDNNLLIQSNFTYNENNHLISVTSEFPSESTDNSTEENTSQTTVLELIYFED